MVFKNEKFGEIRALKLDDEVYFVGSEVTKALGYSNSSKALTTHVEPEDKIKHKIGWEDDRILVNESGMYSLILGAERKRAKEFKSWIIKELLQIGKEELAESGQTKAPFHKNIDDMSYPMIKKYVFELEKIIMGLNHIWTVLETIRSGELWKK